MLVRERGGVVVPELSRLSWWQIGRAPLEGRLSTLGRCWMTVGLVLALSRLCRRWILLVLSVLRRGEGEAFLSEEKEKVGRVRWLVAALLSRRRPRLRTGVSGRRFWPLEEETLMGDSFVGESVRGMRVTGGGKAKLGGMRRGESLGLVGWSVAASSLILLTATGLWVGVEGSFSGLLKGVLL